MVFASKRFRSGPPRLLVWGRGVFEMIETSFGLTLCTGSLCALRANRRLRCAGGVQRRQTGHVAVFGGRGRPTADEVLIKAPLDFHRRTSPPLLLTSHLLRAAHHVKTLTAAAQKAAAALEKSTTGESKRQVRRGGGERDMEEAKGCTSPDEAFTKEKSIRPCIILSNQSF
ncbi:hypothetical protein FN846DRAFT_517741 [Sphaerosporella brunnea]|uniref:Uncharacterized protein n=1 Tax=Sphaerosporella brunnea TaxID=1250544 RepID=A0A5J5EF52_9PEZI|nr:hypothetical protein FN846DRAFT_517741 [Sphaerosporella brunnea]